MSHRKPPADCEMTSISHTHSVQTRKYSVVEENAIYYAGGYVVRKILQKYRRANDDKGAAQASTLVKMIGENADSIEATDTYLDYVKTWTVEVDRGGLIHISNDAFRFFCAVEEVTYDMLKKGCTKEEVIGKVMGHQTVDFYWDMITDGLNEDWSAQLLRDIATLWFTLRGYSVASKLLEEYKQNVKKNVKGTKGLRKELH